MRAIAARSSSNLSMTLSNSTPEISSAARNLTLTHLDTAVVMDIMSW